MDLCQKNGLFFLTSNLDQPHEKKSVKNALSNLSNQFNQNDINEYCKESIIAIRMFMDGVLKILNEELKNKKDQAYSHSIFSALNNPLKHDFKGY